MPLSPQEERALAALEEELADDLVEFLLHRIAA